MVDPLNAFLGSNGYTVSEGIRVLIKSALALDPSTIAPEMASRKAYRDTEQWVRDRVAANFREIAQLLEQQAREIRAMPEDG